MKNDSIVQTSCRRTDLATLASWYELKGVRVRSMSELVRMTIEGMVEVLGKSGFEEVDSVERAGEILRSLGLASGLNPGRRYGRNLFENLLNSEADLIPKDKAAKVSDIEEEVRSQVEKWGDITFVD